ncbi:4Fe-4S binding protein [Candidatus Bathyarchaeota archaeon]|nr:4Fe-4S binding protein [Candidatus Bathyarchaeota archaeon]
MKAKLIYSHNVVEKPILANIVLRTGIPINILEARVNAQKGELIVSIPATGEKLEEVLNLFKEAGVQVQEFTETLKIDFEKCTACGACISPCPTKALRFKEDWTLEFIEEKCVACGICATACPVKAITTL